MSKSARNKRMLLSLSEAEHRWLRETAAAQGTTMSELLRRLACLTERAAQKRAADDLPEY